MPGKGILVADESKVVLEEKFNEHGIENTQENRKKYRHMIFTAPDI